MGEIIKWDKENGKTLKLDFLIIINYIGFY
jgi:hypothetical protein